MTWKEDGSSNQCISAILSLGNKCYHLKYLKQLMYVTPVYSSTKGPFTWTSWCALNVHPIRFEHSHESDLKSYAHRMCTAFNPPREVVWKRIQTGLYYYSWFKRGYACHEIFGLLVGLACGVCDIASFCSALAMALGKKEACFLTTKKEWYSMVKS